MKKEFICRKCDKKSKFNSDEDALKDGWGIVAWDVGACEPICFCGDCRTSRWTVETVNKPNDK